MAIFLGIHEDPGAPVCIKIGKTCVIMVFVGEKNIQIIIADPVPDQKLVHDFLVFFCSIAGVDHQASAAVFSWNQEYIDYRGTADAITQLDLE